MTSYPEKYDSLIDEETWAFIRETEKWYPPDAIDLSIEEQRAIYNKMCRAFFTGYPAGVSAHDRFVENSSHQIPVRQYDLEGSVGREQVIYFHGGGFVVGGLESHDDVCAEICKSTGYRVTSVDYRLAPEHKFPADYKDAIAVFEHIAQQSDLPIIVVGDSAGGNLAAALSHASRRMDNQPLGQVLIYPGLGSDLTQGTFVEHAEAPMLTTADTVFYKTIRTGGDPQILTQPNCTPLNDTDFSELPSTVVVTAQCDPLAGDGAAYCAKVIDAGGQAVLVEEKGLVHGYLRARHTVGRAKQSFGRITHAIEQLGIGKIPKFD